MLWLRPQYWFLRLLLPSLAEGFEAHLGGIGVVHDAIDINALEGDVVEHGAHVQVGVVENIVLANLQQLPPIAQAAHTCLCLLISINIMN